MNCTQANQVSIVSFLQERGFNQVKVSGSSYFFHSPIRKDEKPSFKVDTNLNLWCDHGNGEGGTLIDLVKKMENCTISKALEIISGTRFTPKSLSSQQQKEDFYSIEIKKIQPIQNKALIQYIDSRRIPVTTATKHLDEAYWWITNKESGEIKKYFGLAFKNDSGAYELRNKYWKGSTSPKAITTIPGNPETLNIFEDFFDFLSCLTWLNIDHLNGITIVLNSLSNLKKLPAPLDFDKINLFLDNSTAGIVATNQIIKAYPNAVNQSALIYPGYEDFNDFITNNEMKPNEKE
ncbi:MAG: toprim domain-containing protein [Prolixibacteraceae bacterium]|jgi:hypothetical protein|nr:toprim domain-containing protein [Prolixibacteraceae bacterium]